MQSGRLFALPTSARPTGESGCSSWPTPDAAVFNVSESPESFRARQEALRAKGINGNGCGTPLAMAVKMWTTPQARNAKIKHGGSRQDLPVQVDGKLNPTWVCALMGFPMDWFDGLPDPEPRNTTGSRRARSRKAKTEPSDCER